ncbi:MAG: HU family DNA-binding protein [Bacteroides sp.]|jgi:hypothetical protein BACCOPRO_02026
MTKADVVNEIARKTGIERAVVLSCIECFMESVSTSLEQGESVFLRGFGSFIIKERAEKLARNISRDCAIIVPAHKIPAFKPSKHLMNRIAESPLNSNTTTEKK